MVLKLLSTACKSVPAAIEPLIEAEVGASALEDLLQYSQRLHASGADVASS